MTTNTHEIDDHQVWMNLAKVIGTLLAITAGLIVLVSALA